MKTWLHPCIAFCSAKDGDLYRSLKSFLALGTLVLDMFYDAHASTNHLNSSTTNKDRRREIQTRMIFGDTEIKVSALDVTTGKCVRATIDFLNKWQCHCVCVYIYIFINRDLLSGASLHLDIQSNIDQ